MTVIKMFRGDDKSLFLNFKKNNGAPFDLTGCSIYFTVKEKATYSNDVNDSSALISTVVTSHLNATSGSSVVHILSSQTNSLQPKTYAFDLQLKDVSSRVYTFLKGDFVILPDVTRRV